MAKPERSSHVLATDPLELPPQTRKQHRVLACVLCQQRKVKCDRKFPCANCVRSNTRCIPAATLGPRQRRRRFPERELLERLRRYETLLQQNNIKFEPLHRDSSIVGGDKKQINSTSRCHDSPGDGSLDAAVSVDQSTPTSASIKSQKLYEAKNIWHAMNQTAQDEVDDSSDSSHYDLNDATVKEAWHEMYQTDEHLLFGSRDIKIDLRSLHPEQAQIFRFWQIYIDNVNPLLRVIHVPTIQGRIVDAACNMRAIDSALEALMFGIYCVSVLSLNEDECSTMFGSSKEHLLARYRIGCQQSLFKCGFLRSSNRDCLVALFLYLLSITPDTDPQSLSSILGLVIRIAQRMGLHSESAHQRCSAFEAEMRRRLWWSLVLFDARICEISPCRVMNLTPTWDCKIPVNVNDFDFQPQMKTPPVVKGQATEALFAVVRSEISDFVRHSSFHLDFVNPCLKIIARDINPGSAQEGGDLTILEDTIEEKYLKSCNSENSLHFMTIWTARSYLSKCHLVNHFSISSTSAVQPTEQQRDAVMHHALRILECDSKLLTSPLSKGYTWFIHFHFPLPAYIYIVQDLKRRPLSDHAERCWEIMSDNYEARPMVSSQNQNLIFKGLSKIILQAWAAREEKSRQRTKPLSTPRVVSKIKTILMQMPRDADFANIKPPSYDFHTYTDASTSTSSKFGENTTPFNNGDRALADFDFSAWSWNPTDWNSLYNYGW